jgi:hypothetical protein
MTQEKPKELFKPATKEEIQKTVAEIEKFKENHSKTKANTAKLLKELGLK